LRTRRSRSCRRARRDTLRTLDLSGTRVADPSPLAALESLTDLDLSATPIRELGDWLPRLIGLRRLNLSLTGVRNVQPLAELNGLEWLGLTGVEVEDESPLRRLRRLRHIER
jgi:Leucine-rich repeat (LRR) protein